MRYLIFPLLLLTHLHLHAQSPVVIQWTEDPTTGDVVYTAACDQAGLFSIELDVQVRNLVADQALPVQIAVWGPFEKREVLRLKQKRRGQGYSSRSSYTISQGDVWNVHPDADQIYWLPVEPGRPVRINQGFKGATSHRNDYAIDLDMPVGTPVTAARAGRVIDLKEDSDRHCNAPRCMKYGNFVLIQHEDGTFGNYVHLQQGGVDVEIGDLVEAGQRIGRSGNTGYTSGPHLHFDVSVPNGLNRRTIPFQIMDASGKPVRPREGQVYTRTSHPGQID